MTDFHIHVDAFEISPEFERFLTGELGFYRSDFAGHPEGVEGFEPPHHLTLKLKDGNQFRSRFDDVVRTAKAATRMRGYVEGELLAEDIQIEEKPFNPSVPVPFRIATTSLPPGQFRESEIHVTLDRDRSDSRLIEALTGMGFFAAYLPKPYGTAQIFTVQGARASVGELMPDLLAFLKSTGGAVSCSVKEERIAAWWMSDPPVRLPPVISTIERPFKG